jgi:18S rRNA (adenine1779-N6/adenine1780-N6)-dimethyltransferase
MVEDGVNMKAVVEKVLEDTQNTTNRAAKMSVDDLLK